jgi:hypothetical protein
MQVNDLNRIKIVVLCQASCGPFGTGKVTPVGLSKEE